MEELLFFLLCFSVMVMIFAFVLCYREKVNDVLYRALGGIVFLVWFSLSLLFGDDELGIGGFICYVWALETMAMLVSDYSIKRGKVWIIALMLWLIAGYFAFIIEPFWIIFGIPLVPYSVYYVIAKFAEKRLQTKFCFLYNGLVIFSKAMFFISIITVLGIAVFDHRVFGYINLF